MNLHEYQAKDILKGFGVPIPPGEVATTPAQAQAIAEKFGTRSEEHTSELQSH